MAKVQITRFDGGVNNARSSKIIGETEAVDLLNFDISSGSLVPLTDIMPALDPGITELTLQNGTRSIVRFGDDYFYSDNETSEVVDGKTNDSTLNSTLGFMGLAVPTTSISLAPGNPGDRLTGRYRYLTRFKTASGYVSAVSRPNEQNEASVEINTEATTDVTLVQSNFEDFNANNFLFVDDFSRDHIGYYADARVNHDGRSWKAKTDVRTIGGPLGPQNFPGGSLNKWEDITGATESFGGLESIIITQFPNSDQTGVTQLDIFRTIANGNDYYKVATVDIDATSYEDRILDGDLILREKLVFDNFGPPSILTIDDGDSRTSGKYLTEINERYWLAVGNRLFHSDQSNPHNWNLSYRLDFEGDITALARYGNAVLVFIGNGNPYLVTGNAQDSTISKIQIPSTKGCPNWKTIAYAGNSPVWESDEGVCAIFKQPLGQDPIIKVITKDRYNFTGFAERALAHKESYYLFFSDHAVIFDLERNIIFRKEFDIDYGFSSNVDGIFYLVKDDVIYSSTGGAALEGEYTSPIIYGNDRDVLKNFKLFTIDSVGDATMDVLIDGVEEVSGRLISGSGIRETTLPDFDSYSIQIKLKSHNRIDGYSIEYVKHTEGQD